MDKPSRILVLDDARNTEDLLVFALRWADVVDASLKVLRIIDERLVRETSRAIEAVGAIARMVRDEFVQEARQQLESLSERWGGKERVETEVVVGGTMEELSRIVAGPGADFLILPSTLKGSLGGIASEIVGYSRGNCIVLPEGRHTLRWRRILLATDCSENSEAASSMAVEVAAAFGARLFVLSVVDTNEEVQIHAPALLDRMADERRGLVEDLLARAGDRGVRAEGIVREGVVPDLLVALAGSIGPDVTIMGSGGRTGLNRIFMGSVVGSMIGRTDRPVLVIKKPFGLSATGPSR